MFGVSAAHVHLHSRSGVPWGPGTAAPSPSLPGTGREATGASQVPRVWSCLLGAASVTQRPEPWHLSALPAPSCQLVLLEFCRLPASDHMQCRCWGHSASHSPLRWCAFSGLAAPHLWMFLGSVPSHTAHCLLPAHLCSAGLALLPALSAALLACRSHWHGFPSSADCWTIGEASWPLGATFCLPSDVPALQAGLRATRAGHPGFPRNRGADCPQRSL